VVRTSGNDIALASPIISMFRTTTVWQSAYPDIALHISNYYMIIDIYGGGELFEYHALLIFMGGNCMNIILY
jgi:hypothetical protein